MQSPKFYGFDSVKFPSFRPCQQTAVEFILSSQKHKVVLALPTGGGKSLAYMAAIRAGKLGRCLILTSTKALQEQLLNDFESLGMKNIQGKGNYSCLDSPEVNCDIGPCHFNYDCPLKKGGCLYYDALARVRNSVLVVTNYHYYLAMLRTGGKENGLGEFDTVICDEGHELPLILAENKSLEFPIEEFQKLFSHEVDNYGNEIAAWVPWAKTYAQELKNDLEFLKGRLSNKFSATLAKEVAWREKFLDYFSRIITMGDDDIYKWFVNYDADAKIIKFGPVKFGRNWGDWEFFYGFKKCIIVSATVREKSLQMLGIPREDYSYLDMESIFDPKHSPKIHVKTLSVNKSTTDAQFVAHVVGKIDQVLAQRRDRKGIIHTTSYRFAELIFNNSRFRGDIYFARNARDKSSTIERFKRAKPGSILLGPALSTGYDFPGDQCQYQIITKVPYPNIGDKFLMERAKYDALLIPYMVAQTLVQATGRGTRSETDKCENIILDDAISAFVQRNKALFPKWWLQSFATMNILPTPLAL